MKKLTLLEKFVLVTTSLIIVAFAFGVGVYLLSARSKYEYMSRTDVYIETYRGYDIYATYNSQGFLTGYFGRNSTGIGIVTASFLTVQEVKNCIDTTP